MMMMLLGDNRCQAVVPASTSHVRTHAVLVSNSASIHTMYSMLGVSYRQWAWQGTIPDAIQLTVLLLGALACQ